jgi:copper homeostasis protein
LIKLKLWRVSAFGAHIAGLYIGAPHLQKWDSFNMVLEVCIDSVESAIAAERGGAKRVELCSDLLEGGITPSAGLIASVRRNVAIEVFVMIRPRGGDFCYTSQEFDLMQDEIAHARQLGANGIVLGLLDEAARVDVTRTSKLVKLAGRLPTTFHRAIDMTPDLLEALEDVIATGATRVLTSGGSLNVERGLSQIARMVKAAKNRISIMPGGGLTPANIGWIAQHTGAVEFHSSARMSYESPVRFRKPDMFLGSIPDREYQRFVADAAKVRALLDGLSHSLEPAQAVPAATAND